MIKIKLFKLSNHFLQIKENSKPLNMKFSLPTPGGGSGMTLFSKLIRTKDLRKLQGDDPKSTKPKLTVNSIHNCFSVNRGDFI